MARDSFPTPNGGAYALPYLAYGTQDPTVVPTGSTPGVLYIRIGTEPNDDGNFTPVGLYQKTLTAGKDTNWVQIAGGGSDAYSPSVPANWDMPIPSTVPEGLDQLADRVKILEDGTVVVKNPQQIYVDATAGSDVSGNGTVTNPYQSIEQALLEVTNPALNYAIVLATGEYNGAPIAWPGNCSLIGLGAACKVNQELTYTAVSGAQDTPVFDSIRFGAIFKIDLSQAAFALPRFFGCELGFERLDSSTNPATVIIIYNSNVGESIVRGQVILYSSLYISTFTVLSGGRAINYNSTIGINIEVEGTGEVSLISCAFVGVINGTTVGPDTPVVSADASSLNTGGTITGCTIRLLNDAEFVGYTPANPGDWLVVPETVQEALDALASGVSSDAPPNLFVFKPGGVTAGNTYNSWADMYAALIASRAAGSGPQTVVIDTSLSSPAVIPAGTYDLQDTLLTAPTVTNSIPQVTVDDGVVLQNASNFTGLVMTFNNTNIVQDISVQSAIILLRTSLIANGTAPIFNNIAGVQIQASEGSALQGNVNSSVIHTVPGQGVQVVLVRASSANEFAFSGDATTSLLNLVVDETGTFTPQASQFLGSVSDVVLTKAELLGYSPQTPSDWFTPPTQVKAALDSLASLTTSVEERTITPPEEAAKEITLNEIPRNVTNVSVSFMGVEQIDIEDFSVVGNVLSWSSLGLDTIGVATGDKMVITYESL